MIAFPGNQSLYASGLIIASILLVVSGQYKGVERISAILASVLVVKAVVTAIVVFPAPGDLLGGFVPGLPQPLDIYFILPWVGFILAGAAGVIWYSYWVAERGYGGPVFQEGTQGQKDVSRQEALDRLRTWKRVMTNTALIGVITGGLVVISFLILGTEVLGPEGIVPKGIDAAKDLTRLLEQVWGAVGRWILLTGIFIALWGTILADQDGWGRMFADATLLLGPERTRQVRDRGRIASKLMQRAALKDVYAVVATAVLPLIVFLLVRKPVEILSVAGIVATIHTPVVIFLALYLNRKQLPDGLRPNWLSMFLAIVAGLFFTAFGVLYLLNLLGVVGES